MKTVKTVKTVKTMTTTLINGVLMGSALAFALGAVLAAQGGGRRPASPAGSSSTQIGASWIDITYGRPLTRGRDVFGSGATYGAITHTDGAPLWRAGANVSTRLKTDVPLVINGKTVPAGEYSVFIDVKTPTDWTFILSNWPAQTTYDPNNKAALWGSFGYTPDKDVVRAPMRVSQTATSVDELTWLFVNVTPAGGSLEIAWDKTVAVVPFKVGS
jgi:hypothetical protein